MRVLLRVLGIDWLISRLRGLRRRLWIAMAEQASEKTCRVRRLSRLLLELLELSHLGLCLFQRDVLDEHGLRQDIQRIRVWPQRAIQQRFRVGVLFLKLCLVNPLDERVEKLFFLGSHSDNLRRSANGEVNAASQNETRSSPQSCAAEVTVR